MRTMTLRMLVLVALATVARLPAHAQSATSAAVQFGANIELSDGQPASLEHIEPTIAASPKDPKNLVAAYFGNVSPRGNAPCFVSFTADGGLTWNAAGTTPLASPLDVCFDPSLAGDADGTFYFAYLDIKADEFAVISTWNLRVARSTDGGRSFPISPIIVVGGNNFGDPEPDKPYVAVDAQPKSPFKGTVYLSYTDSPTFDQMIKVTVSRDGGQTWSDPTIISPIVQILEDEGVSGSLPVVAPDGTVYVFYLNFNIGTQKSAIEYARSVDGGRTWSAPADVAASLPSPGFFDLDNGDPKFGTDPAAGTFVTSYPTAAIAPDGTIYVAWTDFPNGSCVVARPFRLAIATCVNADVRLSVSRNGGRSWSAPIKVSDDQTTADQFLPWIAVQPSGLLSLIWLDRRLDPKHIDYDLFYTNTVGGRNFLPNVRVSTRTSKVNSNFDIGHYNNLAVTVDGIFPVWNDGRFNSVQIFTARGTLLP